MFDGIPMGIIWRKIVWNTTNIEFKDQIARWATIGIVGKIMEVYEVKRCIQSWI